MMLTESAENKLAEEKVHPWRRCPKGKHFVKEHVVHVPPNKKHPQGGKAKVHEHCADNPSHKDELSFSEIKYIDEKYFKTVSDLPASNVLKEFSHADSYDHHIGGWVKYWNDIFKLEDPLNPNVVKALIATEFSFRLDPPRVDSARGLMQIVSLTRHILGDIKGELKDFLVRLSEDQLLDPSANICAGVRWLFRKKVTASSFLERTATWEETIIEYKGYWDEVGSGIDPEPMQKYRLYFKRLEENGV